MIKDNHQLLKDVINQRDYSFLALALSLFLLPLSINISTFTLILAIVIKFIQVTARSNKLFKNRTLKHTSLIGGVFFIYIIINSIIQTSFSYTFDVFDKQFSRWLLLILVPSLLRDKNTNKLLLYSFFLGVLSTIVYVFGTALINNIPIDRDVFTKVVDIHHTYIAMYLLFLVNYVFVTIRINKKSLDFKKGVFFIFVVLVAYGIIYILESKVAILVFFILFGVHTLSALSKKNILKYILFFLIISVGFLKFNKQLKVSYKSALDYRTEVWDASIKVINKTPFFGNLTSSEKDLLNFEHYLSGKYYFFDRDLNSHNQYLSIILKYGFMGLTIILIFLINLFKKTNPKTTRTTIREVVGFLIIVSIVSYVENILDRHHGIVFFTVFYSYFIVKIKNEDN